VGSAMADEKEEGAVVETLSRSNPMSAFLRQQSGKLDESVSREEFEERYAASQRQGSHSYGSDVKQTQAEAAAQAGADYKAELSASGKQVCSAAPGKEQEKEKADGARSSSASSSCDMAATTRDGPLDRIVLKFTTISEAGSEAPSFTITRDGATVGRDVQNEVAIPSDIKLRDVEHARIQYDEGVGAFFLHDSGCDFGAGVRISTTESLKGAGGGGGPSAAPPRWELKTDAKFSVGNSVLVVRGMQPGGGLELEAQEGVCKGKVYVVGPRGALLGRSSENDIAVPDRELSRRHSRVEYDATRTAYYLSDCGSTNGTYMLLTGPYGGRFRLSLNDHILVGRTGFSINRYDYGISEEIGFRQTMEDSCVIVQHLGVAPLCVAPLCPQSFFGVFDGHGGAEAARHLAGCLHVNVAEALKDAAPAILKASSSSSSCCSSSSVSSSSSSSSQKNTKDMGGPLQMVVSDLLQSVFTQTDDDFIEKSVHRAHGSTATTVLVLGQHLFCANTGDSRVLLCRAGKGIYLSEDHKPSRPDESRRIKEAGGFVINNRVMGELAVSRAFGDADLKQGISSALQEEGMELPADASADFEKPLIIAEPEVQYIQLSPTDTFLLLGCDGLFDVFQAEEVVAFVTHELARHGDVQKAASALTNEAIRQRNSRDNVSIIIVVLND